jgi:hypothetical protein
MLRFRCRSMSAGVSMVFIGLADIENIQITFWILFGSLLCCLQSVVVELYGINPRNHGGRCQSHAMLKQSH